jgi:hypothetical protein
MRLEEMQATGEKQLEVMLLEEMEVTGEMQATGEKQLEVMLLEEMEATGEMQLDWPNPTLFAMRV